MARVVIYRDQSREEAYMGSTEDRAQIAGQAADIARANAPVQTGEYRSGIGVVVDEGEGLVQIVDDDPEAEWKEYGTSDTPAHAVLVNAASEFGKYSGVMPRGAVRRRRARRARDRQAG